MKKDNIDLIGQSNNNSAFARTHFIRIVQMLSFVCSSCCAEGGVCLSCVCCLMEWIVSCVEQCMENAKAKGSRIGRPMFKKEDIPTNFLKHYASYKEAG